jgi:hypothetical protein
VAVKKNSEGYPSFSRFYSHVLCRKDNIAGIFSVKVVSEYPPRAVMYNSESMGELSMETDSRSFPGYNFKGYFTYILI